MEQHRSTDRKVQNRIISVHSNSNTTIVVPGGYGVSDIAVEGETVTGACIVQAWWGVGENATLRY